MSTLVNSIEFNCKNGAVGRIYTSVLLRVRVRSLVGNIRPVSPLVNIFLIAYKIMSKDLSFISY